MIESLGSYLFQLTLKWLKFKTFRDKAEGGYEDRNVWGCSLNLVAFQCPGSGRRDWERCYELGVLFFTFLHGMWAVLKLRDNISDCGERIPEAMTYKR